MADYRYNNPNQIGLKEATDQVGSLADFLTQKKQFQQSQQQPFQLQEQKAQLAKQAQSGNLDKLKELMAGQKPGQKTSYDLESGGGVKTSEMQPNPMLMMMGHTAQEGKAVAKIASGQYKPIEDQAEAAEASLNSLNQGNSAADKAALINEANMFLKGGGGRAMGAVMQQLTGQNTLEGAMQHAQNWISNSGNIPTLQPAQRNALREAVLGRVDQMKQQHQQVSSTLPVQVQSVAPFMSAQGNIEPLINSYGARAKNSLDRLDQMRSQYQSLKQNAPVSQPSTFSAQPTTLDKIKQMFTGNHTSQQPQASPSPAQPNPNANAPMSFEEFKARKAAGTL